MAQSPPDDPSAETRRLCQLLHHGRVDLDRAVHHGRALIASSREVIRWANPNIIPPTPHPPDDDRG